MTTALGASMDGVGRNLGLNFEHCSFEYGIMLLGCLLQLRHLSNVTTSQRQSASQTLTLFFFLLTILGPPAPAP